MSCIWLSCHIVWSGVPTAFVKMSKYETILSKKKQKKKSRLIGLMFILCLKKTLLLSVNAYTFNGNKSHIQSHKNSMLMHAENCLLRLIHIVSITTNKNKQTFLMFFFFFFFLKTELTSQAYSEDYLNEGSSHYLRRFNLTASPFAILRHNFIYFACWLS